MQELNWEQFRIERFEESRQTMRDGKDVDSEYWSNRAASYSDSQITNESEYGRAVVKALHEVTIPESCMTFKEIVKNTISQPNKCMIYQNLYYLAINLPSVKSTIQYR